MFVKNYVDIELASFDAVRLRSLDGCPDIRDCSEVADAQFRAIQQHQRSWREGRLVIHDPSAISGGYQQYQQFNPRGGLVATGIAATRGSAMGNVQASMQQRSSALPPGGNDSSMPSGPATYEGLAELIREAVGLIGDCAEVTRDCVATARNGGTPQPGCPTIQNCGATPLGFNTFESQAYPLVGVSVGTLTEGAPIEITSGRADEYTPLWMFLSSRDTANNWAEVPGYLTSAAINDDSQLAGNTPTNRPLDSSLYSNVGPLMLDNWQPFTNTRPRVLMLGFGHALGGSASVSFSGAFFGQAKRSGQS